MWHFQMDPEWIHLQESGHTETLATAYDSCMRIALVAAYSVPRQLNSWQGCCKRCISATYWVWSNLSSRWIKSFQYLPVHNDGSGWMEQTSVMSDVKITVDGCLMVFVGSCKTWKQHSAFRCEAGQSNDRQFSSFFSQVFMACSRYLDTYFKDCAKPATSTMLSMCIHVPLGP